MRNRICHDACLKYHVSFAEGYVDFARISALLSMISKTSSTSQCRYDKTIVVVGASDQNMSRTESSKSAWLAIFGDRWNHQRPFRSSSIS